MEKRHILEEIRRTAEANGGKPLGMSRFYQETGIKESDWLGHYWSKWGDAVRESGFEPNELQGARDEAELIESFIGLMRQLRKFPTQKEVRLKASNSPGFPWHNTFNRFGSKAQFVEKILQHCSSRPGYDDVLAFCYGMREAAVSGPDEEPVGNETFGSVYLLRTGRYFKIGRSNAFGRRERELAIQLPEKANTIHVIRTDDPVGIEEYWHKRFASRRQNGEWFTLSAADVKAFKRRKFM
jgi:hypothetical protein